MTRRVSLTRYLVEQQRADGRIPPQLRLLLEVVARACKETAPEELRDQVLSRLRAEQATHH
jgi:hypothetical protein